MGTGEHCQTFKKQIISILNKLLKNIGENINSYYHEK